MQGKCRGGTGEVQGRYREDARHHEGQGEDLARLSVRARVSLGLALTLTLTLTPIHSLSLTLTLTLTR